MATSLVKHQKTADFTALADVRPMVERLRSIFGVRALAKLLGTDPGNLTRYLNRHRGLNGDATRRVIDLDHVLTRAAQVMMGSTILKWLEGHSIAFYGARPIDVLRDEGPGPLLDEISRIESGGYA
ncbi:MAG TPA: hypothetical protein VNF68_12830 [Candidatus Baltobacteraceae bacterium]|nr:hypothetical protein [Candidatus Baltobacteraceae bacterium]